MANASLVVRVSAQIAEFQKSFNDMSKTAKDFASDFEGIATRAAAVGSFIGNVAADIAKSLASGFAGAIKDAVKFSSEFNNAFLGLSSVARAFGTNTDAATAAAKKLSADGLLPLKDSATGLKNLLAAGFSLPEATKLMEAFKDSAAFGRQGALSFGDAVRSATEGVKNGNSILVDNAGITKNLSQILKEAGFSAQDLSRASSDAAVRQALYNGILREAAAQTGDATKLTKTYAGQLEGMRTSWTNLLATWGDAITKNATVAEGLGAVRDLFNRLNSVLSNNQRGYNLVSDAVVGFVKVLAGTVRAINVMQEAFNSMDSAIATLTRAILQNIKIVADNLLKIITIAGKLPGSGIVISAFAQEIVGLGIISGAAGPQIKSLTDRIAENDQRTATWGRALTGAANTLDTLAGTLAQTRGKTVELGDSTERVSNNLGVATKKVTEADKAFAKLVKTFTDLQELHPSDLLKNVSIPIAPPVLGSGPSVKIGGIDWNDFWHTAKPTPPPVGFWDKVFRPSDIGKALGDAISGAIQGGGNVIQSALGALGQTFTTGLAKHLTSTVAEGGKAITGFLGGAINAVLPGLGSLLGPLAGKIGSALKSAFGLGTAGRDLVEQFASTFGGFDALHKKLGELGGAGEQLWITLTQGVGKNNPEQAKAAIDAINGAFDKQKTLANDALGLLSQIADLNAGRLPSSLDPYVQKLKDIGGLTGSQIDLLKGLSSEGEVDWKKMRDVAGKYGIDLANLGPQFQSSRLHESAQTLFDDFRLLVDNGADVGSVLGGMSGKISDLVNDSMKFGIDIPGNFKPLIEKLINSGQLIDANGNKITDVNKLKFGGDLTSSLDALADKLGKLIDVLANKIPSAIDQLSQKHVTIPIDLDVSGELPDGSHIEKFATGGIVRKPTLAVIGEAGPEAVVPLTRSGMGLSASDFAEGGVLQLQAPQLRSFLNGEVVTVTRADAARGGLVPRSNRRSY